jgi:methionine-rich copper-binding protein CopC
MTVRFYLFPLALIGAFSGLLPNSTLAQPTIVSLMPTANQTNASRASTVTVRFSQPLTAGLTALRVFSNQRGGLRTGHSGSTTINGDQLTFAPTYDFKPGETVKVSVTTAAQSSSGSLAASRMYQFTAAATGGNGVFSVGSDVPADINPYNVTMADVDNDGDLDMMSPTFGGASVSIRLNNGIGVFSGGSDPAVGSQPRSVTAGDIDGDGDLDLLTANYNANSISIRFNDGSGTFSGGTDMPVGSQPQSITTADIDGDGDLDMLVANGASDSVTIRFNNGSGIFSGGTNVAVGSFPFNITTGDIDNDGDLDFLTANMGAASNTVSVMLNNGSGSFSSGTTAVMGSRPRWISLGDLDLDGDLDLMSANFGSSNASVRFNNGSGIFSGGSDLAAGASPSSVVASDIDGDGDLDMLVANFFSNNVTVRLNNGSGSYGSSTTVAVGTNPNGIATADVDNDGDLDLLAANFASNDVSVRLNAVGIIGDLIVSSPQNVSGTYNNVTITGPVTGGAGIATLIGTLTVNGTLTIQDGGTLTTNCQPLTGPGSFVLAAGGTLEICDPAGIELTGATGSVQLAGTRSFSTDASYVYNGTLAQVTGGGLPAQVRNLTATNTNNVTLSNSVTVAQVLRAASSSLFLNGRTLTLPSSAAGTALVVNEGAGVVQGNTAVVQRYINPSLNAGLGYRHYSASVSGSNVADLTTSGFVPVVNAAYNFSATPGQVMPFPTVYGYDQSRLATVTSNYSAFNKGWVSPLTLGDGLAAGRGFTVNIAAAAKVDFTGTLNSGNITLALARDTGPSAAEAGWQLVGNPYPAPLDWSVVAAADRTGLDAAMYVFESTSQYGGTYRSYVNGMGAGNPLIGSSQGFFVRVSAGQTSGALTFRNSQRVTSYATQTPFHRGSVDTRPLVQLRLLGSAGLTDDLFMYAEVGATAGVDVTYDATKLANPSGLNLASVAVDGSLLAIDGSAAFTATTILPLSVTVPAAGSFTLELQQLANIPAGLEAYLLDTQTGRQVNLRQSANYSFSVSTLQIGQPLNGRFALHFAAAAPLATATALLAEQVVVYPNPTQAGFTIRLPAIAGVSNGQAILLNSLGQAVRKQNVAFPASGANILMDTDGLAAGVYTLRLQAGPTSIIKRVVVLK